MPQLTREHLTNYVTRYETAPHLLQQGCTRCAVGTMCSTGDDSCPAEYVGNNHASISWPEFRGYRAYQQMDTASPLYLALESIEQVFEFFGAYNCTDPRRAIYESCILELAKRDSLTVPPLVPDALYEKPGITQ